LKENTMRFLLGIASLLLLMTPAAAQECCPGADAKKPNVIVILADDLGYFDIGVQGGKDIPTPHLDSIAKNGVRCTNGYVSCPYCSPTRAGLLTGKYQQRFGHEFNEGNAVKQAFGLPLTETTLADRMKKLGYATGAIGKWHLGPQPDYRPMKRGFDEFYGTLANSPFFKPAIVDSKVSPDPDKIAVDDFYTTDKYADRAVDFIERHKAKPFFLYLPFNACHVPSQATPKYLDRFKNIEDMQRRTYAAMMSALDDAVGRVLGKLREHKLEENTLIFFLSDNGGPMTKMGANGSNNKPLKGQKGDTYEGAVRVPFFVQWKGVLPAGKVYDNPVIQLDITPTVLAAVGAETPAEAGFDGVNLLPFLSGKNSGKPHDTLYWRFGSQWAIRQGDWKLVQGFDYSQMQNEPPQSIKVETPKLYNLANDPNEEKDLSGQYPDRVKALHEAWKAWNAKLKDPLWLPNPPKKPKT
jgi:arylsulfatase A-like enzyme